MTNILQRKSIGWLRAIIQWLFLLWIIGIGIRFGLFIAAIERGETNPFFSHPPGVEGFLPIGALTSLKYLFVTGEIHPVHPASLVIFMAIVLMSLLAKKSFCSWLCPVGTISEITYKIGKRIFGRNYKIWNWLDIILRSTKYLILLFFIKVIIIDMPASGIVAFMNAPYWAISDVKMLYFFTNISLTTTIVLAVLTILSMIYRNFWCRYLCPYGALLGLASMASPFKIRRDATTCVGCQSCSKACPSNIPVHLKKTVSSPECTGCLTCISNCPEQNVLSMRPVFWRKSLPLWVFPSVSLFLFLAAIGTGILTGNWHSSLTSQDYRQLLPMLPYLTH